MVIALVKMFNNYAVGKIMETSNRRKFHRVNFDGQATLDFIHGSFECCPVKNLSLTGMYVEGNFLQKKLTNCFVRIFHPEKTEDNSLQATARVVWRSKEGAGLKFTNMTLENYELLQTTLSRKAIHPMLVLREVPDSYPFDVSSQY